MVGRAQGTAPTRPKVRCSERAAVCVHERAQASPCVCRHLLCEVSHTCVLGDVSPLGSCRYLWACSACADTHALAFVLRVRVSTHECGSEPAAVSCLCVCRCVSVYTRVCAHACLGCAHGLGSLGTDDGFEALLLKVFFLFLSLLPSDRYSAPVQPPQRLHTGEFGVDRVKCGFRKKTPNPLQALRLQSAPRWAARLTGRSCSEPRGSLPGPPPLPASISEWLEARRSHPGPDGDLRIPRVLIKSTHVISIFFMYLFNIYLVEG